jgi:dihydrofolate synthase/folylpolyglutamate synthase
MGLSAPFSSLAEWLAWLETLSPNEIELGLDRTHTVLQRLQLRRPARVISVAGTNGKGSSVAMLEALYLQNSQSVGSFTSPHIHRYNERIRVAGKEVDDRRILNAFARVEAVRQGLPLTYFEYGTLAALCVFDAAGLDTIVLEVGMGGRLDAVNAIEPDGGIITNVSLDHVMWLGHDIESIAAEKAGIFRGGKPFVFASGEVPQTVIEKAEAVAADLHLLGRDYGYRPGSAGRWTFSGQKILLEDLQGLSMRGDVQLQNAAGALALVEALNDGHLLRSEAINAAFSGLQLPGRFQLIEGRRLWILDVAHNAAAADVLADSLAELGTQSPITCIISVLNDKNVAEIIEPLLPLIGDWIATCGASSKSIPAAELARIVANASNRPCLVADSVRQACVAAERRAAGSVLATGSFFTVGPALQWLAANR